MAGRHYLTKSDLNALYFATHRMKRPRGWKQPHPIGRYWRAALEVFFNYGLDTGTVWKTAPLHEPIRWRHIVWNRRSPDRQVKEQSRWGWVYYRRVKTGKAFFRPMNRTVYEHINRVLPETPDPDAPIFVDGSFGRWDHIPPLCPPGTTGFPSHHDASATLSIQVTGTRLR